MMNKIFYKHYVFLSQLNNLIEKNLLKFRNINIIVNTNYNRDQYKKEENDIINFAKKNQIPFLIKNDMQKCIKYNADGVYIESNNKSIVKPTLLKKKIIIIGTAHNQLEYFYKKKQNCEIIALSPIFSNSKFSTNKILGPVKFNLICKNWNTTICALGGVNEANIKKIYLTKSSVIASQRYLTK
jgi:thiamine monophosphate synthase